MWAIHGELSGKIKLTKVEQTGKRIERKYKCRKKRKDEERKIDNGGSGSGSGSDEIPNAWHRF